MQSRLEKQVTQHDKRINKVEIAQSSHEDICALRYQTLLEKHDTHNGKHAKVVISLEKQENDISSIARTISNWGIAFKVFLFCMGVLVGVPSFVLVLLNIVKLVKSLAV